MHRKVGIRKPEDDQQKRPQAPTLKACGALEKCNESCEVSSMRQTNYIELLQVHRISFKFPRPKNGQYIRGTSERCAKWMHVRAAKLRLARAGPGDGRSSDVRGDTRKGQNWLQRKLNYALATLALFDQLFDREKLHKKK